MPSEIQSRFRIECPGKTKHLCVSTNGKTVAAISGSSVVIVAKRKEVAKWPCPASVSDASVSSDGKRIAIASESPNITVHDCLTGKVTAALSRDGAPDFLRNDNQVHAAFYPDGKSLISTGSKMRVYVSDVASGRWQYIMFMKYQGARCAVSPTGNHVVLYGKPNPPELSGHLAVFAINHGLQPLWRKTHEAENAVAWATFGPEGTQVATGGAGDGVRIWNVDDGATVRHLKMDSGKVAVGAIYVSQSRLLVATPDELTLFDLATGESVETKRTKEETLELDGSVDGTVLVTRSLNAIDFWSVTPIESGVFQ